MHTALLGSDFKQISLDLLEKFHFDQDRIQEFFTRYLPNEYIQEIVILSTCNRTEIYFITKDYLKARKYLEEALCQFIGLDIKTIRDITYFAHSIQTINHLFYVGSGTQSMVFGENEILGQIKEAYQFSLDLGLTGSYLNKLFQTAICIGKRVREETNIAKGAYSISSIAIEAIRAQCKDFLFTKILIIGSGVISVRAIKKLKAIKHKKIFVTNRTSSKAKEIAKKFKIQSIPFDILKAITEFDIICFATSTKKHLLKKSDFKNLNKQISLVDLGMPRNIDPEIANLKNVSLITIDQLETIAEQTLIDRRNELYKIDAIIYEELQEYLSWNEFRENTLIKKNV